MQLNAVSHTIMKLFKLVLKTLIAAPLIIILVRSLRVLFENLFSINVSEQILFYTYAALFSALYVLVLKDYRKDQKK